MINSRNDVEEMGFYIHLERPFPKYPIRYGYFESNYVKFPDIYFIFAIFATLGAFIVIIVTYKFAYLSKVATRILKYKKYLKGILRKKWETH